MPNLTQQPKRPRGRPPGSTQYDEPKADHMLTLTPTAWKWLKERGGSKYIEIQARQKGE